MRKKTLALLALLLAAPVVWADDGPGLPRDATFSTLITTPFAIEGLTGDDQGNLYTTGRGASPCPVWRISVASPSLVTVGNIPAPCSPSGITFDAKGDLFVADNDKVWTLTPDAGTPPTAAVYASGVPGTNGLAFDRDGNLWTGDGTQNQGRVWKIPPHGGASVAGIEMFRVQPMANPFGIGREVRTLSPAPQAQGLVANGIAFNHDGDLLIADTARGAIWKVELNRDGSLRSRTGCDTTFTPNTLCLDNILVAHPILDGADGIALDAAGNIWVDANERNAVGVVTKRGDVVEVFRNPSDDTTHLRNGGPLETPTSPFLLGDRFCTANSDGGRRDNAPASGGEIAAGTAKVGKVSCMDQPLKIPGMGLPVR
jgi:sugar lactone lactonase YvrE